MNFSSRDCLLAWSAGLFEGEGYIRSTHGLSVVIEMTDQDVLQTFQDNFGGSLLTQKVRQNYKPTWKWALHGKEAYSFIKEIIPFLHSRRTEKANEALKWYEEIIEKQKIKSQKVLELRARAKELRKEGLTQQNIAIKLDIERSYVSRLLSDKYGDVRELANPTDCESVFGEIETRTSPHKEQEC